MPLFDLKPMKMTEAMKFWLNLGIFTKKEFRKLTEAAKQQAFSVSGLAAKDQVERVWKAAGDAIEKGNTKADFVKSIPDIIEQAGWNDSRVDLILRTTTQHGYSEGRREQMLRVAESRPYWQYIAVQDDRTREEHADLAGKVYRFDDPIWEKIYPYRGTPWQWFNCRCSIRTLSERQMQRYGLELSVSKMAQAQFAALNELTQPRLFAEMSDEECAVFIEMMLTDAVLEEMEECGLI